MRIQLTTLSMRCIKERLSEQDAGQPLTSGKPRKGFDMNRNTNGRGSVISLGKGDNISLTKGASGALTTVTVGLGWQPRSTSGEDYDLDAMAIAVGRNGKVLRPTMPNDFVFYSQLSNPDGTIVHQGDDLTGGSGGGVGADDEQIKINLAGMSPAIDKVVIVVAIYEAAARRQNFGQVSDAFIRIVDEADGRELTRYDLSEEAASVSTMIFGELYRAAGHEWKFRAVGEGRPEGIIALTHSYGLQTGR